MMEIPFRPNICQCNLAHYDDGTRYSSTNLPRRLPGRKQKTLALTRKQHFLELGDFADIYL